jgi:tetratricopeptide (TPR) repeat protein
MNQELEEKIRSADLMIDENPSKAVTAIKEILKEEIELVEDKAYLYYLLGVARTKCGRFFLAKKVLEKANKLLPNNSENLRNLGWIKFMLNEVDEGRNDLRQAISLDLTNPKPYIDLAVTYLRDLNFNESKEWAKRANALDPKDKTILKAIEMINQTEKDFFKLSKSERKKTEKEKRDDKVQLAYRMSILESFSFKKALTKDEAEEVKEEARLNGFSASIITERQENKVSNSRNKRLKVKEIIEERKRIEKEVSRMLRKIKSPFNVEHVKDVIWHEKGSDDLTKIISMFDRGGDISEIENILEIANDAWNYFPHKSLGGLSPMEKILDYQDRK